MDIRFNCPRCGQNLSVEEKGAGMMVNCPNCKGQIEIPRGTTPPPSPKLSVSAERQTPQSSSRLEVSKPGQAELSERKASHTVTVTLSTTALLIIAAVGFFLWQRGIFAPRATVPEIFKTQLMKFLEEGAKTNALAGQGVYYMQLQEQVANTKAAYDLISVTWPPTLELGCRD